MQSRLWTRAIALAVIASVLVTGCGSADEGAGGAAGGGSEPGTLRYSVYSDTPSLDPRLASTTLGYFVYPAYDTLLVLDEDFEPQPYLATEWEQVDPQTWELTLRDDVTFTDGTAFDAEAVKATLESGAALEGSPSAAFYENVESVEVVEPTLARVHLAAPSASFLSDLTRPPGAMISPTALAEDVDLTRATAGTGGWVYDAGASQAGSLHVWTKNDDHWNPDAVKVDRVEMHIIQDNNARLNAVQGGQVDIAGNIAPAQREDARQAGLELVDLETSHVRMMITDRGGELVPALGDPRVRQAIGHLIDRSAYNDAVLAGEGDPDNAGFLARSTPWFDESLADVVPFDPERAIELLEEAGYPDGFTMEAPLIPSIRQPLETVAQMLAEGGITLELVAVADGTVAQVMRQGQFPITYGTTHAVDPNTWWTSTVSGRGPFNPFGLDDADDLDALADEAAAAETEEERRELFVEIQRQTIERGMQFVLSFFPATAAMADGVEGTPIMAPEETQPRPHGLSVG